MGVNKSGGRESWWGERGTGLVESCAIKKDVIKRCKEVKGTEGGGGKEGDDVK
jgi:hypothetical protein